VRGLCGNKDACLVRISSAPAGSCSLRSLRSAWPSMAWPSSGVAAAGAAAGARCDDRSARAACLSRAGASMARRESATGAATGWEEGWGEPGSAPCADAIADSCDRGLCGASAKRGLQVRVGGHARLGRSRPHRRDMRRAVSPRAGSSRRRHGRTRRRHDGWLRLNGLGRRGRRARRRSDSPHRARPRLAGCRLAADPVSRLARPRDEPEMAGRCKHHTASQQQAQGCQHRGPAESYRRTVARIQGRFAADV